MSSIAPYHLLLIEPVPTVAAPIRAFLEQSEFTVDVVSTTSEAKERDLAAYAVLIVDVRRDDAEGMAFVQWLHRAESQLVGRVVVISADDATAMERDLVALGVCDVVPKPVNAQEILRAVYECLEKNPTYALQ